MSKRVSIGWHRYVAICTADHLSYKAAHILMDDWKALCKAESPAPNDCHNIGPDKVSCQRITKSKNASVDLHTSQDRSNGCADDSKFLCKAVGLPYRGCHDTTQSFLSSFCRERHEIVPAEILSFLPTALTSIELFSPLIRQQQDLKNTALKSACSSRTRDRPPPLSLRFFLRF